MNLQPASYFLIDFIREDCPLHNFENCHLFDTASAISHFIINHINRLSAKLLSHMKSPLVYQSQRASKGMISTDCTYNGSCLVIVLERVQTASKSAVERQHKDGEVSQYLGVNIPNKHPLFLTSLLRLEVTKRTAVEVQGDRSGCCCHGLARSFMLPDQIFMSAFFHQVPPRIWGSNLSFAQDQSEMTYVDLASYY